MPVKNAEKISVEDQKIANQIIGILASTAGRSKKKFQICIEHKQQKDFIDLPNLASNCLIDIIQCIAKGKSVSMIPSDKTISTQEAADLIGVSRPHIVKLLEAGEIPFKKVGSHRRVLVKDIEIYEQRLQKTRKQKISLLAKQAQELNLGY
ncbi:MAG: helix-turn-helix domain-containing protein [Bacteroidota bacterium]|jgi:excisionase family DNA binding protein